MQLHEDSTLHSDQEKDEANGRNNQQTCNSGISMFSMTAPDGTTGEVSTAWVMYMTAMNKKID